MTNNMPPIARLDNAAVRRGQEKDLLRLTEKTRRQYDRGLLTLEEFITEMVVLRNSYYDNPDSDIWVFLTDDLDPDAANHTHASDCNCRLCRTSFPDDFC